MLRTAFTLLVLAVLSMSAAIGSPAAKAKTHGSTQPAVSSHTFKASVKETHRASAAKTGQASGHATRHGRRRGIVRGNARKQRVIPKTASLHGSRVAMPPPLVGSFESLARQNDKTEDDNLERIEDEDDLADRIARKVLVPVPASEALTVNGDLPENHRYCRPWTALFLNELAKVHSALFHKPVEVSSAVRTVDYQKQLIGTNGNAAAAEGDVVSPHVTGATVDIAKQGLTRQEMAWMRSWLLPLQKAGKIDVEEEFQQACFHITVYKAYFPPKPEVKTGQPKAGAARTNRRHSGQSAPLQSAPGQDKAAEETKLAPLASAS
jgi:Family of unknown function (DUF5715)